MEEIVNEQIGDDDVLDVMELVLDEWKTESIKDADKGFLEKFKALDSLSLAGCGIKSLVNFPNLPELVKLDLSGNSIKDGLSHLKHLTSLMQINLIGNPLEDLNEFECFRDFTQLVYLEIDKCPIASEANVKEKLFKMIQSLKIIDGFDENGKSIIVENSDDSDEDELSDEDSDYDSESDKPVKGTKGNDRKGKKK
jgi:hypothetical protein